MHEKRSFTRVSRLAFGWGALLVVAASLAGCDSSGTEEEGDVITRIELRLQHADTGEVIAASIRSEGGLTAGAVVEADTLYLQTEGVYNGRIDLFNAQGVNITTQVRQQAEDYQLFYTVDGADGIVVQVTDLESDYGSNDFGDDLRVGLTYQVTVAAALSTQGNLRVQVGAFGPGRKNGRTLTVEPIVDVRVPLKAEVTLKAGPGDAEIITRTVLTLVRVDGTQALTATATEPAGLHLGETLTPSMVEVEACTIFPGGEQACSEDQGLLLQGGVYEGYWYLFQETTSLDQEIMDEGEWHQFFYNVNFGPNPFTIQDTDRNGLPLGFSFLLSVPTEVIINGGSFRVGLGHFDPAFDDVKTGQVASRQYDLRYSLPMSVHQNGRPELMTRTVLTLQRADALETITITAEAESLRDFFGEEPDSLVVETCTGPEGQQVCASGRTLTLTQGMNYTGAIEVFNDETGEDVMAEIREEDVWHQFVYDTNSEVAFLITDTDVDGRPFGFSFEISVPATPVETSLRIILDHYGRFGFKELGGNAEQDFDFSVPLSVP